MPACFPICFPICFKTNLNYPLKGIKDELEKYSDESVETKYFTKHDKQEKYTDEKGIAKYKDIRDRLEKYIVEDD